MKIALLKSLLSSKLCFLVTGNGDICWLGCFFFCPLGVKLKSSGFTWTLFIVYLRIKPCQKWTEHFWHGRERVWVGWEKSHYCKGKWCCYNNTCQRFDTKMNQNPNIFLLTFVSFCHVFLVFFWNRTQNSTRCASHFNGLVTESIAVHTGRVGQTNIILHSTQ